MTNLTSEEMFEKYGKAWRYVKLLEEELDARTSRHHILRMSLALNAILLVTMLAWWWK